jgi:hypothetical protein
MMTAVAATACAVVQRPRAGRGERHAGREADMAPAPFADVPVLRLQTGQHQQRRTEQRDQAGADQ